MNVTDGASEETIVVAPYWPGEGYGGGTKVASMEEAIAEAKHLAEQGYGKGKSIIHIVRTTRTVIEWNSDHSELAALPRPEADEGAVAALKGLLLFFTLPGETSIDRFERQAAAYRRETGRLAPGKDEPMEGGSDMEPAERHALFDIWVQSKVSAALAALPRPEASTVQKCAVSGYPAGHPDACNDCDPCIHWRLRWTDGCPWRSECARVCPCHMMEQEMPAIDGADDHEPFDPANPKLKPCPFCGGEAELVEIDDMTDAACGGNYVACKACEASTNLRFSAGDDARPLVCEQWNSRRDRPRPEADEGAVDTYDIPAQLDRMADWLAPLHGAWVARTAARELRDGRSRYRVVASALCRERGLVPDELISDAGHEVWELVAHEEVQKESAALAAAQEGS